MVDGHAVLIGAVNAPRIGDRPECGMELRMLGAWLDRSESPSRTPAGPGRPARVSRPGKDLRRTAEGGFVPPTCIC